MKKNVNPSTNKPPADDTVLARLNDPSAQDGSMVKGTDSPDPHQETDDDTVLAHINGPSIAEQNDEKDEDSQADR